MISRLPRGRRYSDAVSEDQLGGLILIAVMGITGLGVVWVGRAGARRSLDWSWGGHTVENTPAHLWDEAHRRAGPMMAIAGWLLVLSGLLGAPLLLANEVLGGVVIGVCIAVSITAMVVSIVRGTKILGGDKQS